MRKDIEKESLMQCLSWCALRELPPKYDGKNVYIKAKYYGNKDNIIIPTTSKFKRNGSTRFKLCYYRRS